MTPFDWDEFLEFAEEQALRRGNPAAERSAISCACYAVFHKAQTYAMASGHRLSFRADDHGTIARWFESSPNPTLVSIGLDLGRLRRLRRQAGYEERFPNLSADARSAVLLARTLVEQLSSLGQRR